MALKTIVKVGGITNLSDARYCAGMGVDMLGFCFSKSSSNYINIEKFKEIIGWISGVDIIAEFGNENKDEIDAVLSNHSFDGILTENLEAALYFQSRNIKIILDVGLNSIETRNDLQNNISSYKSFQFVQLSSDEEATFTSIDKNLSDWSNSISILKSYDNNTENLLGQISKGLFKGISLNGTYEEKPGFKDYDEIADILEILEDDD